QEQCGIEGGGVHSARVHSQVAAQIQIVTRIVGRSVQPRNGLSNLELVNAGDLPAANGLLLPSGSAFAERQFVYGEEREAMRMVERRNAFFGLSIGVVQPIDALNRLRPLIVALQLQSVREALAQIESQSVEIGAA